jgi:hypothetical protein
MTLPDYELVKIDTIDIGDRYRAHPEKDLDTLAESIDTLGLLHPIVITPEFKLVAGQRRIMAYQKLGFDEIESHIIRDLDDANLLLAEHNENTCRVAMTTGEALKLFKARKELLVPLGKEKSATNLIPGRKQRGKSPSTSVTLSKERKPTASEIAAKGTGKSASTLERAEKIAAAAADTNLPDPVRELAAAKETAVNNDEEAVNAALAEVEKAIAATVTGTEHRGQAKAIKAAVAAFEKHAAALESAFIGADNFDADCDIDTVRDGFKQIRAAVARVNKCGKEINYLGSWTMSQEN